MLLSGGNLLVAVCVCVSGILYIEHIGSKQKQKHSTRSILRREQQQYMQMYVHALILILFAYAVKIISEGYSMVCHMCTAAGAVCTGPRNSLCWQYTRIH